MSKLTLWQQDWDQAEKQWDAQSKQAAVEHPIKRLNVLPDMPGITPETARHLKWKSFKWMVMQDHDHQVLKGFFKHPFKYGWRLLKSLMQTKSFEREGDFFLYGVRSITHFKSLLHDPEAIFILGFSYCHKPFECPSGRFTEHCAADVHHPVCQQCFIGKSMQAAQGIPHLIPLFIPTIHYIGGKVFEIIHRYPGRQVLFMITACEMTLKMFGDWGNMANIKGLGVRLDGRICNTMKAFELSEQGIKPGLTVVLDAAQEKMLEIIRHHQTGLPQ